MCCLISGGRSKNNRQSDRLGFHGFFQLNPRSNERVGIVSKRIMCLAQNARANFDGFFQLTLPRNKRIGSVSDRAVCLRSVVLVSDLGVLFRDQEWSEMPIVADLVLSKLARCAILAFNSGEAC